MLFVARRCVGRDLVDARRRVGREVAARLLVTLSLLTFLSDETNLNEHYEQRETEVRCDAQQAVCGLELRLVEVVRARQSEVEGRGRLRCKIQPANRGLMHTARSLVKPRLPF